MGCDASSVVDEKIKIPSQLHRTFSELFPNVFLTYPPTQRLLEENSFALVELREDSLVIQ